MNIEKVGILQNSSINNRYFFDMKVRKEVESLITRYCHRIGYTTPLSMEWRNIGSETDIYEFGVALRINRGYELRYKLISEDFNFWYYDRVDPKTIIEDTEPSDNLEPVLLELFKCLAEDYAKIEAVKFLREEALPSYPDEPETSKQPINEAVIGEVLRRY